MGLPVSFITYDNKKLSDVPSPIKIYIYFNGLLGTVGVGTRLLCNADRILPVLSHKLEHETLGLRGNPSIGDVSPRVGGKLLLYT